MTTCVAFLSILGFVGLCLWCTGKMPGQASEARHAPRSRRPRSESRCDACDGCTCPDLVYCYCPRGGSSGASCDCCGPCECGECVDACKCDGCCNCESEAAAPLAIVGLVLVAIFVLIGLVVGVFFSVIIVQRLVQRHMRVLHLRGEAHVHHVLDLADRPELLDVPDTVRDSCVGVSRSAYEAPDASLLVRMNPAAAAKPGSSIQA